MICPCRLLHHSGHRLYRASTERRGRSETKRVAVPQTVSSSTSPASGKSKIARPVISGRSRGKAKIVTRASTHMINGPRNHFILIEKTHCAKMQTRKLASKRIQWKSSARIAVQPLLLLELLLDRPHLNENWKLKDGRALIFNLHFSFFNSQFSIVLRHLGSRSHQYCFASFFCAGHTWSSVSPSNISPFFIT